MTACTDDERREVARRLRELADYCDENEMSISDDDWPGILSDYIWPEDGGYHIYDEDCRRLADLIYPDTTTDTTKTPGVTTKCDRDALLALAEDVTEAAAMATAVDASKSAEMLAELLLDIARRIREACGEVAE